MNKNIKHACTHDVQWRNAFVASCDKEYINMWYRRLNEGTKSNILRDTHSCIKNESRHNGKIIFNMYEDF